MSKKTDDEVTTTELGEVTFITTGVPEIDTLVKGFARGRITELWGTPGIGKSYVLAKAMASLTDGQRCLYIDTEFSLVKDRLVELGVDFKKVQVVQDGRLEKVTEYIISQVGVFDLIIIDSLAKLIPMNVDDTDVGVNSIGLFARQVKHFEAKLKPRLARSKTALVAINQARAGLGPMAPAKPQGGFAWEHGIDVRLKLSKPMKYKIEKQVKGQKVYVGHNVEVKVEKSRLTQPYISTIFQLLY